jgi:hypothetical protein
MQNILCWKCVGESYLSCEIKKNGKKRKCTYCQKVRKSYELDQVADRVETAFQQHYIRTPDQPTGYQQLFLSDRESTYNWYRDGDEVSYAIMNATDIPLTAAKNIQEILCERNEDFELATMCEETEFASGSYYEEKGPDDASWQAEWQELEMSLKSQSRFFNTNGSRHLTAIFHDINQLNTHDGKKMVLQAGPGSVVERIYRARVFQSEESLQNALSRPDLHLGPPPSAYAKAGRMNANGISVFYGANNPEAALAEVRPPVGSIVAIACFDILMPVRLLDLTALENASTYGSIFDPSYIESLQKSKFLRSLCRKITKPVMPDDEAFDYLITQAIADFLANDPITNIDGIIFPSVQAAGIAKNIVLFHKASQVEKINTSLNEKLEVSLGFSSEDGWEDEYTITSNYHPKYESDNAPENTNLFQLKDIPDDFENFRVDTLKIDLTSIKIHHVNAVSFSTKEDEVTHRTSTSNETIHDF